MSYNLVENGKLKNIAGGGGSDIEQFIGTTEEWNDLPAADKEKYDGKEVIITDDYVQNEKLDIYSTDEIVVGRWIDGKPIYRKVVKGVGTSLGISWDGSMNRGTVPISADIDTVCDFKWHLSDDSLKYYYPIYVTQQINSEIRINNSGNAVVSISSIYNYAVFTYTFIVEYTKTTDV